MMLADVVSINGMSPRKYASNSWKPWKANQGHANLIKAHHAGFAG